MSRRVSVLFVALLLAVGLMGQPADAAGWVPPSGPAFNNPVGRLAAQQRLSNRVVAALDHSPRGSTVRFAIYSFDLRPVADAIVRAHRRGVHVQVVLNDNWISTPTKRLRRVLGDDPDGQSFVVICKGSCRGGAGNLHMKVYAFSHTGRSGKVLMTGSANLTRRAEHLQWNDLYTIRGAGGLYDTFVRLFSQLKYDKPVANRWVEWSGGRYQAQFYRRMPAGAGARFRAPAPAQDPVMQRLRAVRCKAVKGAGLHGRTVVRIMMYGWGGDRGRYLASRVAYLKRQGCNVKVVLSVPGGGVARVLRRSHVPVRSADWDYLKDGTVNFYSHLKVMALNGTYHGRPTHEVWTGSENWSGMSFRNDELSLGITGRTVWRAYADRFNSLWAHDTHRMGLRPTSRP